MKNLLQCKNKFINSKEAYKRATGKKKADRRLTCISDMYWIEEVLWYWDVLEISKFQQVGVVNRKTETNRNDESPTLDEERVDREIRETWG